MRINDKLIEEVVTEVAGPEVLKLVKKLKDKKNVSEFKLAEAIKQEINTTRNMLYKLHSANLVSFTRKKDKAKGWYIYYWTFEPKEIKHQIISLKTKKLQRLKERLEREKSNQFYACESRCVRLDFDQSVNFEFKCPECGQIIQQEDNSKKIKEIGEEIAQIEKELKELSKKDKK